MLMRTLTTLMSAFILFSTAAYADRTVRLDVHPGEWIGAITVTDDGSAVAAIASREPRQSRLLRFDAKGTASEVLMSGIAVNSVQVIDDTRVFLKGATGPAGYTARLVDTATGAVLWDAASLGPAITTNEEAIVAISDDGRNWAALQPLVAGRFRVLFGSMSRPAPATTYNFETQTRFSRGARGDFTGGSWDLALLAAPNAELHAAILTPQGSVYVVSASSGLKTILSPSAGGGHIAWHADGRKLWVQNGERWVVFDLSQDVARKKEREAAPWPAAAEKRPLLPLVTGSATTGIPLADGGFARQTRDEHGTAIEIFANPDAAPERIPLPGTSPAAVVRISPRGRAILILPDGPRSSSVVIRTR
jgi:hypothetical protein